MPLEGRDQNPPGSIALEARGIPQCPWRGEIKTGNDHHGIISSDTTMPLEGRDQNRFRSTSRFHAGIPQCPWRGEIKTPLEPPRMPPRRYHNALGGARSKHRVGGGCRNLKDTTMPLEGRDQNGIRLGIQDGQAIPQCPWRGEIKTFGLRIVVWSIRYHNALGGARSKHRVRGGCRNRRYHNALGGARSKQRRAGRAVQFGDTTMPLEGRDQNQAHRRVCEKC